MSKITGTSQKGQNVPSFTEDQARDFFEIRRWPNVPVCPHCASVNVYLLGGKSTRPGLRECRDCDGNFTVTVGTVMEDSHLPLATWAKAFHLMASSKKGVSALQLQRQLGLGSYRTAWFLAHRIREAMRCQPVAGMLKNSVQVDEAYIGGKPRPGDGKPRRKGRGTLKAPVMVLVESGKGGKAVSRHVEKVDGATLGPIMREVIDKKAALITDELPVYKRLGQDFEGGHYVVNHAQGEYSRGGIDTNTAESYFALLKRGVIGSFHHVSKKHLHRYCDEFSFRWSQRELTDADRRDEAVKGAEGKRLMYKNPIKSLLA
jgi:transposase-like protein